MSGRGERLLVSGDYLVTLGDPAVIADGAVIVEDGRMTVDEDALRERLLSLAGRLYPVHPAGSRLLELAGLLLPHAQSIYDRWYQVPIDAPASVYNARRPPAAETGPAVGWPAGASR